MANLRIKIYVFFHKYGNSAEKQQAFFTDHQIEAQLFPNLFQYGTRDYVRIHKGITREMYFRIRLLNMDPLWDNDIFYLFFGYYFLVKERILEENNMVKLTF